MAEVSSLAGCHGHQMCLYLFLAWQLVSWAKREVISTQGQACVVSLELARC